MERCSGNLRSGTRTGGAMSWTAVAERSDVYLPSVITKPESRGLAISIDHGPQFNAPAFHKILASSIEKVCHPGTSGLGFYCYISSPSPF